MPRNVYQTLVQTRETFFEETTNYCLLGATNPELAMIFGVGEGAISQWIKTHPQFAAAVSNGRDYADAQVAGALFKRANGYEYDSHRLIVQNGHGEVITVREHVPADVSAAKFWLVNRRANWREKQSLEHFGPNGGAIETEMTVKFIAPPGKQVTVTEVTSIDGPA